MSATAKAGGATLDERVAARSADLSAAERRVARYLADFPEEVAFASAGTLGNLTRTSDATVIRTVKALGYSGLPALKRTLQDGIRVRLTPPGRLARGADPAGTDPAKILERVLAESVDLLEEAQRTSQPEAFAKAVRLIGRARETVVIGAGGLGILGSYLTLSLTRLGRHARTVAGAGDLVADDLVRLGKGDVLVVIAGQQVSAEINLALDRAAEVGAKVVLITDALGDALAGRVAVSVSAPIGRADLFSVDVATLALLDAFALAISAVNQESAAHATDDMIRLRKKLRGLASGDDTGRRRRNGRKAPRANR
jgi:DNA-binding MurR/RpiR family transcriptional regulator